MNPLWCPTCGRLVTVLTVTMHGPPVWADGVVDPMHAAAGVHTIYCVHQAPRVVRLQNRGET